MPHSIPATLRSPSRRSMALAKKINLRLHLEVHPVSSRLDNSLIGSSGISPVRFCGLNQTALEQQRLFLMLVYWSLYSMKGHSSILIIETSWSYQVKQDFDTQIVHCQLVTSGVGAETAIDMSVDLLLPSWHRAFLLTLTFVRGDDKAPFCSWFMVSDVKLYYYIIYCTILHYIKLLY